jgi:integrase
MPRLAKGPYLKKRKQAGAKEIYYIIDGDRRTSTGFDVKETAKAKEALDSYIRARFIQPPSEDYYVVQAIELYRRDIVPKHKRPKETEQHLERLMEFFRGQTCEDVTPALTAAYERWRTHTGTPTLGEPPRDRQPIKPGSVRRDLEMLRAAFKHAFKCRKLKHEVPITLPPKSPPRERWLTRSEAARLLAGSLGFVLAPCSDIASRRERLTIWRREPMVTSRHLARFVLIGLRTGTRSGAILDLGWQQHPKGGFFDLDRKPPLMFRAATGETKTKKRKPTAPVPPKLLPHLERWKSQASGLYVVALPGAEDASIDRVNKAFNAAVARAGLDRGVTPHILRHTCVTWLMQKGESAFNVGHFVGMSVQTVIERYGHHAPDYLQETANAA